MKSLKILLSLIAFLLAIPTYGASSCGVSTPPKLVFIIDDSGSIDDTERAQMSDSIQKIIDGVEASHPDTLIGTLQYIQEAPSTPQDGQYGITLPYTSNLTISIVKSPLVPVLGEDHLPDSVNQMITDGIFNTGGALEEPDMFFIYTDAARANEGVCCSVLENTGGMASTDAAPGYGEYAKLAGLATSGDITLYHSLPSVGQEAPGVAQGDGIYRSAVGFTVAQADIDAIVDNIVSNIGTVFTGEVSETDLPITSQLKTGDKLVLPSKSISPLEGHLRAYTIGDDGKPATTASWDAATKMSASGRAAKLYSTDTSGNKILLSSLDDAAFGSTGSLTVSNIKDYTIDPSASSGIYLADRKSGSFLGGVSRGNSLDIIGNQINTSLYLYDTTYRDFFTNTVKNRKKLVLMSSDDGFLYAFDYDTGSLAWGWMPRSLASELVNYSSFQSKHLMAGTVDILDLKDSAGNYATYIVGSYKSGLGHYVLKLGSNGSLSSIVWDDDQSSLFNKSPNNGEMEFFSDGSGTVYAVYVLTNSTNTSRVVVKSVTDSNPSLDIDLNYEVTSSPFVMQDYGKSNAPEKKTLYVGTAIGNIHVAGLLTGGGIKNVAAIIASLQSSPVATMDDSSTDAITYINSSVAAKDNKYYLSAQTLSRLTVLKYDVSNTSWKKKWTSYVSGAGSWSDAGTYSADNSGVPSDQGGFAIVPPTGIQSLPVDAKVTDKATIVADAVVLPLNVLPASSTTCAPIAYYYVYSLTDGKFPKDSFFKTDNTAINTNIVLGYGEASRMTISDLAGKDKLVGYGLSDQRLDNSIGIGSPFIIKDPVTAGIRSWKEIGR